MCINYLKITKLNDYFVERAICKIDYCLEMIFKLSIVVWLTHIIISLKETKRSDSQLLWNTVEQEAKKLVKGGNIISTSTVNEKKAAKETFIHWDMGTSFSLIHDLA